MSEITDAERLRDIADLVLEGDDRVFLNAVADRLGWRSEPPSWKCKVLRMDKESRLIAFLDWRDGETWSDGFWWLPLPPTPEVKP